MKIDEFIEIMDDSKYSTEYIGDDTVFEGLKILKKYGPFRIEGAEHEQEKSNESILFIANNNSFYFFGMEMVGRQ